MQRVLDFRLILLCLIVLLLAPAVSLMAQSPDGTPPRPAPPNKPISPGERPQDVDDLGYCTVGGSNSTYCNFFDIGDCVPIPTSLRVPVIPEQQDTVGWSSTPEASGCGTEPCYVILRCECGNKLLNQVCGA